MIARLLNIFPPELWIGAILGALVSAIFSAIVSILLIFFVKIKKLFPIKQFLGEFADKKEECAIFIKWLFSNNPYYYSRRPDYFPPRTTGQNDTWQNIPYVIAKADMQAATDFLNLLGQVGKKENIDFYSIPEDWDLWTKNLVSIGGHFKTDKIFETCNPQFVSLDSNGGFRFCNSSQSFVAINNNDYGLIYKTTHPVTKKSA